MSNAWMGSIGFDAPRAVSRIVEEGILESGCNGRSCRYTSIIENLDMYLSAAKIPASLGVSKKLKRPQ